MKIRKMKKVMPMLHSPGMTSKDRFWQFGDDDGQNKGAPVILPTPPAIMAMVAVNSGVTPL